MGIIDVVDSSARRHQTCYTTVVRGVEHDDMVAARHEHEAPLAVHSYTARIIAGTPSCHHRTLAYIDCYRLPRLRDVGEESTVDIVDRITFCGAGKWNLASGSEAIVRGREDFDGLVGSGDAIGGAPLVAHSSRVAAT